MFDVRRMSRLSGTTLTGLARLTVFVAALAGSCRTSTAAGPNLVANGGLETVDQKHADRPRGFRSGRVGKSFSEMAWTSPGHNSRRCISVTTKDSSGLGYWQTLVTVKPLTRKVKKLSRAKYTWISARTPSSEPQSPPKSSLLIPNVQLFEI